MKAIIAAMLVMASFSASAATAYWTGRSEMTQTVTYQMAWKCEYQYLGQKFWRLFKDSCPASIEIE